MAGQKIQKLGVKRESGWLYFLDKDGDVSRAKMARGAAKGSQKPKPEKVAKVGLKRESGWMYYLDGAGDLARTKMAGGGGKR